MKQIMRIIAALSICATFAMQAAAQSYYPDKPVRLIVPYAPGGSASAMAQLIAPDLGQKLGQSVYVDHRPGGNTIIGTGAVAKSAADGYTLLLTASSHVVVPLMTNAPYDAFKDFVSIATLAKSEFVLVVKPTLPARNLREFIAMAKAKPGEITYGSAGSGSGVHLATEMFAQAASISLQHIPYKGSGPVMNDLLGGQLDASFQTPTVAAPYITSGRLRALAVTGGQRIPLLPDVPTLGQAGGPNVDASNWFGVVAPAGTPENVVNKIADAVAAVCTQPEVREKLAAMGFQLHNVRTTQFTAEMKAESARMSKVIQSSQITMN